MEAMSEPFRVECSDVIRRSVIDNRDTLMVIDELSEFFRQGSEIGLERRRS